jgi:uncharacterized membrane protein
MTATSPSSKHARRYALWLLPVYPLLAIAGAVSHRQVFALLALALLLTVLLLPQLLARSGVAWLFWFAVLAGLLLVWLLGFVGLLLEAIPVLINALLAIWFGASLATSEPLVERFIIAIEGAERLQQPGVITYARQVTWFWALLLGAQAPARTFRFCVALACSRALGGGVAAPGQLCAAWRGVCAGISLSALAPAPSQSSGLARHAAAVGHPLAAVGARQAGAALMSGHFEQSLRIDAGHPALPGHFPGHPLVPGVILLEQVALALRCWRDQRLVRVIEAKFVAPLLPDETATLRLTGVASEAARVRFEIRRDDQLLARGVVEGAT